MNKRIFVTAFGSLILIAASCWKKGTSESAVDGEVFAAKAFGNIQVAHKCLAGDLVELKSATKPEVTVQGNRQSASPLLRFQTADNGLTIEFGGDARLKENFLDHIGLKAGQVAGADILARDVSFCIKTAQRWVRKDDLGVARHEIFANAAQVEIVEK